LDDGIIAIEDALGAVDQPNAASTACQNQACATPTSHAKRGSGCVTHTRASQSSESHCVATKRYSNGTAITPRQVSCLSDLPR